MKHIKFRYKDEFTNGEWSYQECYLPSLQECINCYGLDQIEYEILLIEEVE